MPRLLSGLLFALLCHGIFLLLPVSCEQDTPPRPMGERKISITLSPVVEEQVETQKEKTEHEETETTPTPPAREEVPPPLPPAEETGSRDNEEEANPAAVVSLKAVSRKKRIIAKPLQRPAPDNPVEETVAPPPPPAAETSEAAEKVEPALIKAIPLYSSNPKPEYPPLARRRHYQGSVMLLVLVSPRGHAQQVTLHKSSDHSLLDKSAIRTVRSWRFQPGTENGAPVAMEVLVPIHFRLKE